MPSSTFAAVAGQAATSDVLEQLLHTRADIWRARSATQRREVISTGFRALDAALHDGGWPLGATTELLSDGLNWPLLLPALMPRLPGYVFLIDPPCVPSAAYLAHMGVAPEQLLVLRNISVYDNLWAADQALRAGASALVCQWLPNKGVADRDLRQLQQAAVKGGAWHVLLRSRQAARTAAPAALRLAADVCDAGLQLTVLKQRGGWAGQEVQLALWPQLAALALQPVQNWPVHLEDLPVLRQGVVPQRAAQLASLVNG
ncbi:SOS cell division inhibitor SulA [Simiduia curdlanivorans]|uniref:SOS cell division inhibitor SulA n=1 Tax=Simiduia curdlanivorans TaxID=1492769 RepID=A0ABV8V9D1_9GAMM|nr:SOS cell division inhibitor SulA [Simiduia curdlanivorans]MDN3639389.1 SOS cell division inhibitor SulA [Simiduia curdlanivorans]